MHLIIPQWILNGLISGSIYALVAIGFTVIYRTVKFFHFAHGAVLTLGAYLSYSIIRVLPTSLGWTLGTIIGIIGSSILGVVIYCGLYSPLLKKHSPNLVLLIASFGAFIVIQNTIQLAFGAQVLVVATGSVQEGYRFLGAIITGNQGIIVAVSLLLSVLLWLLFHRTRLGMIMRAVSDDQLAARLVGVNSETIIVLTFAIGSAIAGVAGILISIESNLVPAMGFNAILKGITASIVGGIDSIVGALLGGLFIGLAENMGAWFLPAQWKDTISFLILIFFLLVKPSGFTGSSRKQKKI